MDRTSDFDLMKHNLTDVIEFTKIIIDYDGFNPTTDFWQPLVTTYFKLIDLPTDHDSHDGSHPIRGGRPLGVGRASGKSWKPSFHSCVSSESRKVSTNCLYSELEVPKDSRP